MYLMRFSPLLLSLPYFGDRYFQRANDTKIGGISIEKGTFNEDWGQYGCPHTVNHIVQGLGNILTTVVHENPPDHPAYRIVLGCHHGLENRAAAARGMLSTPSLPFWISNSADSTADIFKELDSYWEKHCIESDSNQVRRWLCSEPLWAP